MLKKKDQHTNLARWSIELTQYDNLQIEHVNGKRNTIADALSRIAEHLSNEDVKNLEEANDIFEVPYCLAHSGQTSHNPHTKPEDEIITLRDKTPNKNTTLPILDLATEQRNDPELEPVFKYFEHGTIPIELEEKKIVQWYAGKTALKEGILIRNQSNPEDRIITLVTPTKFRRNVFEQFHKKLGHMSLPTTLKACKNYMWRTKGSDIRRWYNACHECQLRKPKQTKIPLTPVLNTETLAKVGLDLCGPFPITQNGNKYILNIVDWFTKYVVSIPIPDSKALTTAKALVDNFILVYGTPVELITDNAKTFTAESFKELARILKINKIYTTPYHSAGNGATERTFRTFQDILSKFQASTGQEFDELLPIATFAYNSSIHATTGFSPFVLMFGREPIVTLDLFLQPNLKKNYTQDTNTIQYKTNLMRNLEYAKEIAAHRSERQALKFKRNYDKKTTPSDIEENDQVLLRNYTHKVGESFKLEQPWKGPYKVQSVSFPHATLINPKKTKSNLKKVHLDQIKRYYPEEYAEEVSSDEEFYPEKASSPEPKERPDDETPNFHPPFRDLTPIQTDAELENDVISSEHNLQFAKPKRSYRKRSIMQPTLVRKSDTKRQVKAPLRYTY